MIVPLELETIGFVADKVAVEAEGIFFSFLAVTLLFELEPIAFVAETDTVEAEGVIFFFFESVLLVDLR